MEEESTQVRALELVDLGYRQVSRGHRLIARVDMPREELEKFFIKNNFGNATSGVPCLSKENQEEYYRRCNASHIQVSEELLKEIRRLSNLRGWGRG